MMKPALLKRADIDVLIQTLKGQGYRVLGPRLRADAIKLEEIDSAADLPRGIRSEQAPGRYRWVDQGNDRYFDFAHGPDSLKRFLFAPEERLWSITADGQVRVEATQPEVPPTAVIGARPCDVAGARVQDRTFLQGQYSSFTDPYYATRRKGLFVVAVNCVQAGATCFCASMGTGPRAQEGFDLVLTELRDDFLVEAGSPAGEAVAAKLPLRPAAETDLQAAAQGISSAAASQTRHLDTEGLYELLFDNLEHPRWDDVAARCLSCANCVMVCPTCFCHREEDIAALDGTESHHVRRWDACFTLEHGSIHGLRLRPTVRERYRQWLTHKLGAWTRQFGVSGCVGCGRCITWCPTGIDLTEEVAAIRAQPGLTTKKGETA